jgi:hypothetical protein
MLHTTTKHQRLLYLFAIWAIVCASALFVTDTALAHCDTMDGPVVKAAEKALAKKNVNLVLIWVQEKDEAEVKERFRQTLAVRSLNREARKLADNYFFETVVRLHRAGEGEPYTGIEPAGTDMGPVIPVADKALLDGSADALVKLFDASSKQDIESRFADTISKKKFGENDVAKGRQFVKAYVNFMHFIEHLYEESHRSEEHIGALTT